MVLERRLLLVSGKGGTGKSTVAAGLALLAASTGRRTLLCDVDGGGRVAELLEAGPLRFAPREVQPLLWAMSMDTEESLKEYLSLQLKVPLISRIGPLARVFDFIANAAPGVKEILTVGKVGWEVRAGTYDLVVVDAPATGHVLGLLGAPRAIDELLSVGPIREQTGWLDALLRDPAQTGVVVVAGPDEMQVAEALELVRRVGEPAIGVDVACVVVNRVLPELFGRGEEAVFDRLCEPDGRVALDTAAGGPAGPVLDGAALAVTLRRSRAAHLAALRSGLPPTLPIVYLPELFVRSHGIRSSRQVAEHLASELL